MVGEGENLDVGNLAKKGSVGCTAVGEGAMGVSGKVGRN